MSLIFSSICDFVDPKYMSSGFPDLVAECALRHYNRNISKGKPKDESEWTVYAAIVAEEEDNLLVISAATGTKCTAIREEGFVLHDSHAEGTETTAIYTLLNKN